MANPTGKLDEPSIDEGLALLRAFMEIKTATDRRKVVELAKRLAEAVKPRRGKGFSIRSFNSPQNDGPQSSHVEDRASDEQHGFRDLRAQLTEFDQRPTLRCREVYTTILCRRNHP